jgi:hypothetical protein
MPEKSRPQKDQAIRAIGNYLEGEALRGPYRPLDPNEKVNPDYIITSVNGTPLVPIRIYGEGNKKTK